MTFIFPDPKQHQATYWLIKHSSDASYGLKALNQKLYVDNLAYLLWDIYGNENKLVQHRVTNVFIHVSGYFFT
jgi:hypothetical protein